MKLEIITSKVEDLKKATDRLLVGYVEEITKLHPDKADELEAKVKQLQKQPNFTSQKELKKLLQHYFKNLNQQPAGKQPKQFQYL